jgi:hypothetical protein
MHQTVQITKVGELAIKIKDLINKLIREAEGKSLNLEIHKDSRNHNNKDNFKEEEDAEEEEEAFFLHPLHLLIKKFKHKVNLSKWTKTKK